MDLTATWQVIVQQRKELAELFGFETRNKYEIFDDKRQLIGFCAEQQKGFLGILLRQFLGHWRTFDVHFFDHNKNLVMIAKHPFRFFFQEFHIYDGKGVALGWADQRFGIFTKKFDVMNAQGDLILRMRSGLFKIWTFPLKNPEGVEKAIIRKRWGGILKEAFMDADNFSIEYEDATLNQEQRLLILALSVFTDLQYFEKKGGGGFDLDIG
ncbi:MAG: hypothetical protein K0R29_445 [Pseudobdellovibrio sp.]|nr:hypothetical protein [Pseudobdellovibrio sp.]